MSQWKTENWWISEYNFSPEFRSKTGFPANVELHDATLRDGEQTPGVVFSVSDKIEIAEMLDSLKIDRIEAGMPAVSETDQEAIKEIVKLNLDAKIYSFCRGMEKDIDLSKECGVDGVIIEMPVSTPKLQYQFTKWSEQDVIDISINSVRYAKEQGLEAVYFGYDTTRADWDFLQRLYSELMEKAKPDSIGLVDTMGCLYPGALKEWIKKIKSNFDVKLEIHTHNEFGMATASSLAAVESGVEVVHGCLNGMGERSGNANLQEIMVGLSILLGLPVKYNFANLKKVSERVAEISAKILAKNQPIVGSNVYVRESGIGIDLVMNQPLAMFPLNPLFSGNTPGILLGKKSGLKSVEYKLEQYGRQLTKEQMEAVLQRIKKIGITEKRTLTDEEFLKIIGELGH